MTYDDRMGKRKTWLYLYRARTRAGYSLARLAREVDCHPSHLSMVESGKRAMSPELQASVAEALGIDVDALIFSAPEVTPRGATTIRLAS